MKPKRLLAWPQTVLVLGAGLLLLIAAGPMPVYSHDAGTFSAGEPGNPKKPSSTVLITMREGDGKMMFVPEKLEVRRGEQIRFLITNVGELPHEFVLASTEDNLKHAELMKKYPDMEHDDPNGKTVQPKGKAEIIWRFTKRGEFEFACLIPGHRKAGMTGKIIVK
jgi:uncharacterized cupredoxin-like copper-binding protein